MKKQMILWLLALVLFCTGCAAQEQGEKTTQETGTVYGQALPVSRALAARMLALTVAEEDEIATMDQQISFADVGKADWWYPYVNFVCAKGYMQGTGEGFSPNAPLTGSQAAVLLDKLGYEGQSSLTGEENAISLALWTALWREVIGQRENAAQFSIQQVGILQTANQGNLSAWQVATTAGTVCHAGYSLDAYVGQTLEVVCKGKELLAIGKVVENGYTAEGAYCHFEDGRVEIGYEDSGQSLVWEKGGKDGVYDVVVTEGVVTEMTALEAKEKLLVRMDEKTIFFADDTSIPREENMTVYDLQGKQATAFAGATVTVYRRGEQAAAIVLNPKENREDVAMVLGTGENVLWPGVEVMAEGGLLVNGTKTDRWSFGGEAHTILTANTEGQWLEVKTEGGSWRVPEVHIWAEEGGCVAVAKMDEATYLSGMVAGQLLADTGLEAAKAQAILARSRLYVDSRTGQWLSYGGQVDSSGWQEETALSRQAVEETRGQVLAEEGEVVAGTYFSVSCGAFAAGNQTWPVDGVFLKEEAAGAHQEGGGNLSLTAEMTAFLTEEGESADDASPWYRWKAERSFGALSEEINGYLAELCKRYPLQVKVRQADGQFLSQPVETIGQVTDIAVCRRGNGGNVMELIVYGTEKIIFLRGADVICAALGAGDVNDADGNTSWQGQVPSPFFVVEKTAGGVNLIGGGYGHGVGLSQWGAKEKAAKGERAEEILSYYFPGKEVTVLG